MDEVFLVVRHYSWEGDRVISVWADEEKAIAERDRLNEGDLPEEEDLPISLLRFGDQWLLDYQVRAHELNT